MRIAVLNKNRCKPKDCNYLCVRVCPRVKTGEETIIVDEETKKPVISEGLCSGCGICVKKCPFAAIHIINLPEETGQPVYQYGTNGFRLYNLPTPRKGVVGIVGANGIGKTTLMKLLSGDLKPNLGSEATWEEVLEKFRGNEIQAYLEQLSEGNIKAVYKPQYVDAIPKHVSGKVGKILEKSDETGKLSQYAETLNMEAAMEKDVKALSGGELQKMAIIACLIRDADVYLIDEPSSYLDVGERLNVARAIQGIKDKFIFVVEHDLVVLDYLSDYVHVIYGTAGAYGAISDIKGVRAGINEYLGGFLKSENTRFREPIKFHITAAREKRKREEAISYPKLDKKYDSFSLDIDGGSLKVPEVLGILGPNATGKTTFVKMLAGVVEPDGGKLDMKLQVSYKPQYVKANSQTVRSLKIKAELVKQFSLIHFMEKKMNELSGGELQRVAIADCLSKDSEVYLLDEPSAYLDVEERLKVAKYIRKFADDNEVSILVVDHDISLVDYVSDVLMVFSGVSGKTGRASKPLSQKDGMNSFLKEMHVTFRRDSETGRPRANKPDSVKDREQKESNQYYYVK